MEKQFPVLMGTDLFERLRLTAFRKRVSMGRIVRKGIEKEVQRWEKTQSKQQQREQDGTR